LNDRGRAREAEPLLQEAFAIRAEKLGPVVRATAVTGRALGVCLASLGRSDDAEKLLLESYRNLSGAPDSWSQREETETLRRLVTFYRMHGNRGEAARFRTLLAARPSH
jgi:hypothetical protein